jgi:hypothetical protein
MSGDEQARRRILEAAAGMRMPQEVDQRLQWLMDRNNEGALTPAERDELEALVEASEMIALVRAKVLRALGQEPS